MPVSDQPSGAADVSWLVRDDGGGTRLLASQCPRCGTLTFPQSSVCPECQARPEGPVALSPDGVIYAVTVVRVRPPDYAGPVPYGLGLVELPEGLRIFSVLLAEDLRTLTIGAPVRVTDFPLGTELPLSSYAFRPVSEVCRG